MKRKGKEAWCCDSCHRKVDTLYFVARQELCEECRRPRLYAMRRQWYGTSYSKRHESAVRHVATLGVEYRSRGRSHCEKQERVCS